jgi:hypothetical protein
MEMLAPCGAWQGSRRAAHLEHLNRFNVKVASATHESLAEFLTT